MDRPVTIYCFTGTGNTLIAARAMGDIFAEAGLACDIVPLERADPARVPLDRCVGVACPVAVFATYPLVWRFLEALPVAQGTPFFLLATMGGMAGGLAGPVRAIITAKGYRALGARQIVMPSNMFVREGTAREEEKRRRAVAQAAGFARELIAETAGWNYVPVVGTVLGAFSRGITRICWGSTLARRMWKAQSTGACTGCGLCARVCPVGAASIDAATRRAAFGAECEFCFRCAGVCPAHAIRISGGPSEPYCALPREDLVRFVTPTEK